MRGIPNWVWNLISTVLAVIAIFVAYHIFFLNKPKREVTVNLKPPVPLISIKEPAKQEFKIFYKDNLLENASVYTVNSEIINSGNEPIEEDDYSEPIKFIFNQDNKLISVSSRSDPNNIKVVLKQISDNEVEVNKILLNQGDKVYSTFLIQSKNYALMTENLKITARIKGVKRIKKVLDETERQGDSANDSGGFGEILLALGFVMFSMRQTIESILGQFLNRNYTR